MSSFSIEIPLKTKRIAIDIPSDIEQICERNPIPLGVG